MHPLVALPVALIGFLLGRFTTKNAKTSTTSGSPLDDVTLGAWEKFVGAMATSPKGHVGRRGRLGAFQVDARRLTDVGAMTRAWKGRRGTEEGVWVGDWLEGLTEAAFLGSMPLQYAVFTRSCRAAAPKVSEFCGREVDGQVASLSGLLGVCHAAGERGVGSFVNDESTRERFPATREVFARTNGIF